MMGFNVLDALSDSPLPEPGSGAARSPTNCNAEGLIIH